MKLFRVGRGTHPQDVPAGRLRRQSGRVRRNRIGHRVGRSTVSPYCSPRAPGRQEARPVPYRRRFADAGSRPRVRRARREVAHDLYASAYPPAGWRRAPVPPARLLHGPDAGLLHGGAAGLRPGSGSGTRASPRPGAGRQSRRYQARRYQAHGRQARRQARRGQARRGQAGPGAGGPPGAVQGRAGQARCRQGRARRPREAARAHGPDGDRPHRHSRQRRHGHRRDPWPGHAARRAARGRPGAADPARAEAQGHPGEPGGRRAARRARGRRHPDRRDPAAGPLPGGAGRPDRRPRLEPPPRILHPRPVPALPAADRPGPLGQGDGRHPRDTRALQSAVSDIGLLFGRNGSIGNLLFLGLAFGISVALYFGRRNIAPRGARRDAGKTEPSRRARLLAAWG